MELVEKATKYILENKKNVNPKYRSKFHVEPSVGWMNDPNGLIFVDGEFHLFYQANPYSTKNENMSWGHMISKDLIKYKEVDMALYPEGKGIEDGCFSGSAFIENGEMKLVYTNHMDSDEDEDYPCKEDQYLCFTKDKIHYEKDKTPCIDVNELPDEIDKHEVRDPQIAFINGWCYLFVGGHTTDQKGVIIVYRGKDSKHLHYDFYIGPSENTHFMVECPSYVRVDNKDVIIYSSYGLGKKENGHILSHSVFYILGEFKGEEKRFVIEAEGELDRGDSFYAPKTIENIDTPIMIAWMENWNKIYRTAIYEHKWVGSFSIPRVLKVVDNKIYQEIHPNLYNYIVDKTHLHNGDRMSTHSLNEFTFKDDFKLTLKGDNGQIRIRKKHGRIRLDTLKSNNFHEMVFKSKFEYNEGKVTFLLDTSSIEIFIDDGKETISSRYYIDNDSLEVINEKCLNLISKRIEVNDDEI